MRVVSAREEQLAPRDFLSLPPYLSLSFPILNPLHPPFSSSPSLCSPLTPFFLPSVCASRARTVPLSFLLSRGVSTRILVNTAGSSFHVEVRMLLGDITTGLACLALWCRVSLSVPRSARQSPVLSAKHALPRLLSPPPLELSGSKLLFASRPNEFLCAFLFRLHLPRVSRIYNFLFSSKIIRRAIRDLVIRTSDLLIIHSFYHVHHVYVLPSALAYLPRKKKVQARNMNCRRTGLLLEQERRNGETYKSDERKLTAPITALLRQR